MNGKLLNKARSLSEKIITKGGFHQEITISTPSNDIQLNVTGLFNKHWINVDSGGNISNSKNASATFSEKDLLTKEYPFRNNDQEVYLFGHKVSTADSSGEIKEYIIKEWYPDETLGIIVCILGDYESD